MCLTTLRTQGYYIPASEKDTASTARQKIKHVALQRSDCKQAEFIAYVMIVFDPTPSVWINETGCDQRNAQ